MNTSTSTLNWTLLGSELRQSALEAHEGQLPSVEIAYQFLLFNPECFSDTDEWPVDMPAEAPNVLRYAYFRDGESR